MVSLSLVTFKNSSGIHQLDGPSFNARHVLRRACLQIYIDTGLVDKHICAP